jgi:hypothetical protein
MPILAKAAFSGIAILIILTLVLLLVLTLIFPSTPPQGIGPAPGAKFRNFVDIFAYLYFCSMCVAGFVSGFLVNRWQRVDVSHPHTWPWHSLISGFIIGISGPFLWFVVLFPSPVKSVFINEIIRSLCYGFVCALTGVFGYYVAVYKHRRRSIEKEPYP